MRLLLSTILFTCVLSLEASNTPPLKNEKPTYEEKLELATAFIKKYDQSKTILNWKIKVREDRVVLSKRWGIQRIVLFDQYFVAKLKEQEED